LKTDLLQLMKNRRSIRKYHKDSISFEKICQILKAGRYSPSGANQQPWIYVIVTNKELKEKIRKEAEKVEEKFHKKTSIPFKSWLKEQNITTEKSFLTEAPALIVIAGFTKSPYWLESTWLSIAYILLSAEDQALGTLTYTPSETTFLNDVLNIPEDYRPVAILPIGKRAEKPPEETRPRKSLRKMIHLNIFAEK
jgi:nitroreductase